MKIIDEINHEINQKINKFSKLAYFQKLGLGIVIFVVLTVVFTIFLITFGEPKNNTPSFSKNEPLVSVPSEKPQPRMTSKEQLDEAKKAILSGDLALGIEHLNAINQQDIEYTKAQKLLKVVEKEKKKLDRLAEIAARGLFAKQLEQSYLSQGMDMYVSTLGKDKTTIKFKYVLFSRPLVYNMTNDASLTGQIASLGFKKIIFTDGYDNTWTSTR